MSAQMTTIPTLDRHMRRNLFLLACCQAVGQAANTMMFTATALSVVTFYPRHDLATLPITLRHVGVMLSVFPAALLMQRMGRRFGFQLASCTGMLGAAVVGFGLYVRSFELMCLGGLGLGYSVASLQMYRFAAVELAPSAFRAKTISWVTAGGVVAGVLGPSLARWSYDQMMPLYLATYAAMGGLHVIVFSIMAFIKFPSMREAPSTPDSQRTEAPVHVPPPRPLWQIAAQPRYFLAVIAGMVSYGTMSFLMSASPLAIVGCGLPHTEAHWVIFLHVMGMFVPSFFTGNLISRYGVLNIMACGTLIFLIGIATGLAGVNAWNFRIALLLNGVGWNFVFVGATTLVTMCYRPNERGKAQALNDFLVFGTTATASFMAGMLQDHLGWFALNWFSVLLVSVAIIAVASLWVRREAVPA
jgi:MFS family permease